MRVSTPTQKFYDRWHVVGTPGEPIFYNGWTHYYSATQEPMAFRRLPSGLVVLRGVIKGGSMGVAAMILPVGFRPMQYLRQAISTSTAYGYGVGRADIGQGGEVYIQVGSNTEIDLSGIAFPADR